MQTNHGVFADNAIDLRRAGFAVLPANGKRPLLNNFNNWRFPPGETAVAAWAERNPDADIAYIPGLTGKRGGDPIIVLDGDDRRACDEIVERFGDTPGKIRTRRGGHFLYDSGGADLGKLTSLRSYGLNVDLKHGNSIAILPPSRHAEDRAFRYAFDGCDETVLRDLPVFKMDSLQAILDRKEPILKFSRQCNYTAPPPAAPPPLLFNNSRGLGLNRFLCSQAWACETFDDLLDCAHTFNMNLESIGEDPLDDDEICKRTAAVWNDLKAGKLQRWHASRTVARTDADEIKDICARGKNGGDAVALLMLLRAEHQARILRGETFALNTQAMAEQGTLDWTVERFRNAIKLLLEADYIRIVSKGKNTRGGRKATQYTLTPRVLSPSMTARDAA